MHKGEYCTHLRLESDLLIYVGRPEYWNFEFGTNVGVGLMEWNIQTHLSYAVPSFC